jgi:hypothetical protein
VVTVPLSAAAVSAINAVAGGDFALGGTLTSLSGGASEFLFGGSLGAQFTSQLTVTLPEPSAIVLQVTSALALVLLVRIRRWSSSSGL